MKRPLTLALTTGVVAAVILAGSPAYAAGDRGNSGKATNPQKISSTTATLPLSHAVTLQDAVSFAPSIGGDITAFKFDNGDVEGEYSPSLDQTLEQFLAGFSERFGTQPEVTGVVVKVSVAEAQQRMSARSAPLDPGAPAFDAPAVTLSPEYAEVATPPAPVASAERAVSVAAASDWRPNDAQVEVTNQNGRADFFTSYWWHSGSVPGQMPAGFGAEFEVNLYNTASSTVRRPACDPGYKDKFWAKNYSWNWALYKPDYSAASHSGVGAYADYNDLSDPCNRNSIAIGMRYPRNIQSANNQFGVMIWVSAPRGTTTTSKIGGVVQAVSDSYCTSIAGSAMSLTDCMGVYTGSWPIAGALKSRTTLNETRLWTAPPKCWQSQNKGSTAPVVLLPC